MLRNLQILWKLHHFFIWGWRLFDWHCLWWNSSWRSQMGRNRKCHNFWGFLMSSLHASSSSLAHWTVRTRKENKRERDRTYPSSPVDRVNQACSNPPFAIVRRIESFVLHSMYPWDRTCTLSVPLAKCIGSKWWKSRTLNYSTLRMLDTINQLTLCS